MTKYQQFGFCERGETHIALNMKCEDAVKVMRVGEDLYIGAVADGLGSATYCRADRGAQFAVEEACSVIKEELLKLKKFSEDWGNENLLTDKRMKQRFFGNLNQNIAQRWHSRVNQDIAETPFSEEEENRLQGQNIRVAYACTLIAVGVTDNFWFSVQVGDGNCMEFYADSQELKESTPKDPMCIDECTTHLAMPHVVERNFRNYFSTRVPELLLLHSDGIDDTLIPEGARFDAYEEMIVHFCNGYEDGKAFVGKKVRNYAHAKTEKMDDTTVAGIVNVVGLDQYKYEIAKALSRKRLERALEETKLLMVEKLKNSQNYEGRLEQLRGENEVIKEKIQRLENNLRIGKQKLKESEESIALYSKLCGDTKSEAEAAEKEIKRLEAEIAQVDCQMKKETTTGEESLSQETVPQQKDQEETEQEINSLTADVSEETQGEADATSQEEEKHESETNSAEGVEAGECLETEKTPLTEDAQMGEGVDCNSLKAEQQEDEP